MTTGNGDGHRVAQATNGVTTTYVVAVLDLSQVLVETTGGETIRYVFGHDGSASLTTGLLAEHDGVAWAYHLDDGLGSVRQLADGDGQVTLAQSYAPFGEPLWNEGSGTTEFGFTGERWEAYSQLLFLRARYYEPASGRFTSRDPWSGDIMRPSTLQAWVYAGNNPVWLVDPSGLQTPVPQPVPTPPPPGGPVPTSTPIPTAAPQPEVPDYRDLTHWLYNELHEQANSQYVQRLVVLHLSPSFVEKGRAYAAWYLLVKDKAKWDFKHQIQLALGNSIALGRDNPPRWYEYSVPGNIFYGFVGSAATFPGIELHAGAGVAEIRDPAHVESGEACCPGFLGCYYVNWGWWYTGFDEPGDWWNVEFGIKMFQRYGRTLTFDQFQDSLSTQGHWLTQGSNPGWDAMQSDWPYAVGRFNGPKAAQYESAIRFLLSEWW